MDMDTKSRMVDYRQFRLRKLNTEQFCHLKLLLFWPLFGLLFLFVERGDWARTYAWMYCTMDEWVPFCEYFLIPYLFWFVFLVGIHIYTLLFDVETFTKMMKYIIITYLTAMAIYFLFPTAQNLRPEVFERDNALVRFIRAFYQFDTNTNVCPSIHVIGSLAVMFAAWNSRHFHTLGWKIAFGVVAALISVSTVFLKQHSVVDILVALPICLLAYPLVYKNKRRGNNMPHD